MKKSVFIWIVLILAVIILSYLLFSENSYYGCDNITINNAKNVISSYKDFSYIIIFFIGIFAGWLSYKVAEKKTAEIKPHPNSHIPFYFLIFYGVFDALLIGVFLLSKKIGWFSLDILECEQVTKWISVLIKQKSLFGSIGISNFYIAHSLDLLLVFLIVFFLSFYITKKIS